MEKGRQGAKRQRGSRRNFPRVIGGGAPYFLTCCLFDFSRAEKRMSLTERIQYEPTMMGSCQTSIQATGGGGAPNFEGLGALALGPVTMLGAATLH